MSVTGFKKLCPCFIVTPLHLNLAQSPRNPIQSPLNHVQSPLNPAGENMSTPTGIADPNIS